MRSRIFLSITILLLLASCGRSIEKQARDQVRQLSNAELKKNQVTVSNVNKLGEEATAEIDIHTAVKMRQQRGKWIIEEIRLGRKKWEEVDRIVAALELVRIDDTRADMEAVRDAARSYTRDNGPLPLELDFVGLIDLLAPRYLAEPIREDAWDNPFTLLITNEGFQIRSTGPDGRPGNDDDLVLNDEK